MADDMSMGASIPFESPNQEDHHVYQNLFTDNCEEMGLTEP